MHRMTKLGLLVGTMALSAAISSQASARVVCVNDDCWHSTEAYDYPTNSHVVIHEDDWAAGPAVRWREHTGRGYWHGDSWEDFQDLSRVPNLASGTRLDHNGIWEVDDAIVGSGKQFDLSVDAKSKR